MNKRLTLGSYYYANSWIHKLDPRTKIVSSFLFMISVFLTNNILMLFSFFFITLFLIISSTIPIGKFLKGIRGVLYILLLTTFFQIVFNKSGDLLYSIKFNFTVIALILLVIVFLFFIFSYRFKRIPQTLLFWSSLLVVFGFQLFLKDKILFSYSLNIYSKSLEIAFIVLIRIITIVSFSSLLTLTTATTDINSGLDRLLSPLKKLKINTSIFTMMVTITLRNIPTIFDEVTKILKAQASRGVDIKEGNLRTKIKQLVSLLVPLFVIAYGKSADLADAMEARGYDPKAKRSSIVILKLKFSDIKILLLSFFFLAYVIMFAIIGFNMWFSLVMLVLIFISIWI
jgi:energy-coupling factor transport system permease protein